jgi:hypothetical protein
MKSLKFAAGVWAAVVLAASGCTSSPGSSPTVSFTSPLAAGPSNGSSYKFKEQPVTLSIKNAVRTASATATYALEIATDAGFANKVFTRDGIPEGGGDTTTVTVSSLAAASGNVTYYWRWMAAVDGTASPPSATQSFVIQQQIVLGAPTLSEPANGTTMTEARPRFVARNASRQGAVGAITYQFQVSRAPDFSSLLFDVTVAEQSGGQTSWTPGSDLPTGTAYWRVRARDDANGEWSGFTGAISLIVEPFDPHKATFWNNPPGIAGWPETAKITSVDFSTGYMLVDFDRRTGPNAWPENASAAFGPIQYTLGMCFKLGGEWHCSAPTRFWIGRDLEASGRPGEIPDTWFYDPARWGPMVGHRPAPGELVAFWVGQGSLRSGTIATNQERSNFALVRFGENYRAN